MNRLFQLTMAHKQVSLASCLLRTSDTDEVVDFTYSFWLLEHPGGLTLIDCGLGPAAAARKSIVYERTAVAALESMGIAAADIDSIVLSHPHFDHAGSLDSFPSARIFAQRADLEFFTGPYMRFPLCAGGVNPGDMAQLEVAERQDRLTVLDGDCELFDGVALVQVGGHTPGSQLVIVDGGARRVVLTGDAAHLHANLAMQVPYPVLHDVPSSCVAFETIIALDDERTEIVPGHDGMVRARHDSLGRANQHVIQLL